MPKAPDQIRFRGEIYRLATTGQDLLDQYRNDMSHLVAVSTELLAKLDPEQGDALFKLDATQRQDLHRYLSAATGQLNLALALVQETGG
jgi:hypothetical protein